MLKITLGLFALGFMVLMLFGPLMTFIANEEVGAGASFERLVPSLLLLVGVFALSGILFRVLGGRD